MVKSKILILAAALMLVFSGCGERTMFEITENNESVESSLVVMSEIISTFDIIEDLATSHELMNVSDESFLTSEVKIEFLDTVFTDGDGLEVILHFGELGSTPQGVLCKDGKYRAGDIKLMLSNPYQVDGAELSIIFPENAHFYSGDGQQMVEFIGEIKLERDLEDVICMAKALDTYFNNEYNQVDAELFIKTVADNGVGLQNDVLSFEGEVELSGSASTTLLHTSSPLKKNYTSNCTKNVVEGELFADFTSTESEVFVDFDPFDDQACDNVVAITINGKTVIHSY